MWYQKLILGIILSVFVLLFEWATEGYRAKVLGRRDRHGLTGLIRFVFILAVGFGNPTTIFWWQGSLLAFAVHWMFFDGFYNVWILEQRFDHFGNNIFDRLQKWLISKGVPIMALYFIRLIVLASAIKFYIDPYIW